MYNFLYKRELWLKNPVLVSGKKRWHLITSDKSLLPLCGIVLLADFEASLRYNQLEHRHQILTRGLLLNGYLIDLSGHRRPLKEVFGVLWLWSMIQSACSGDLDLHAGGENNSAVSKYIKKYFTFTMSPVLYTVQPDSYPVQIVTGSAASPVTGDGQLRTSSRGSCSNRSQGWRWQRPLWLHIGNGTFTAAGLVDWITQLISPEWICYDKPASNIRL